MTYTYLGQKGPVVRFTSPEVDSTLRTGGVSSDAGGSEGPGPFTVTRGPTDDPRPETSPRRKGRKTCINYHYCRHCDCARR